LKGQPPPKQQGIIKQVVTSTFEEIVLKSKADVLFVAHTYFCTQCKYLLEQLKVVSKCFADNENIVIATMDYSDNEYPEFELTGFPFIVFYKHEENPKYISYFGSYFAIEI